MLSLKGKLKRIDSGMSTDDFAMFISENVCHKYVNTVKRAGMMDSEGNLKPVYQWEYFLWRSVQAFKASAYVVRPEYEQEVIGALLMLGTIYRVITPAFTALEKVMGALGLKPLKCVVYGETDPARKTVSWGTISASNVLPGVTIMALGTDQCWFVYPVNIQRVNRLLSRKEKRND